MTHLTDTSAVLAHYFGEPGRARIRELVRDPSVILGVSTLTLYEIETRLIREGLSPADRRRVVEGYASWFEAIVPVTEAIAAIGASLRAETSSRIAAVDGLIAATALHAGAILVHRDAHFAALPPGRLVQETLPEKV